MARKLLSTFLVIVLVLPAFSVLGYETLMVPTEVRHIERSRVYEGYTLFPSKGTTYLIDMDGGVLHTWARGNNPKLLESGNLLDVARNSPGPGFDEVDWNSSVVWSYVEKRPDYAPHHDFNRIFDKKLNQYATIYIANKRITDAQAIAAGCDPATGPYDNASLDAIVEVDMNGTVVWEWWFLDHGIQDIDATKANYVGAGKNISDYPGRINLNMPGKPLRTDWLHCNALDYNPALDQIAISSVHGEIYVIDHGNTFIPGDPNGSIALAAGSAGDFIYRFGDPARYGRGDPPAILEDWTASTPGHKQLGGAHDIQWIRPGLPGAGHLLVFNNAQFLYEKTPQSYAVEINPYLDSEGKDTGHYVDPPAAGYHLQEPRDPKNTSKQARLISNQTVWTYGSKSALDLYDQIGCSVQRLPNGNTLIDSCAHGRMFEVTAKGDIVWEYVNPDTSRGITTVMPDSVPMSNSMFRAHRLSKDYPAFAGRDLTAGDPMTGPVLGPDFRPPGGATETFYLDNSSTYGGYTLFPANGTTYLVDLEGRVVNTWGIGTNPRLLDNGTLLDAASGDIADLKRIEMMDWNGKVLWSYAEARPGYVMHHDFLIAQNRELNESTLVYLASRPVSGDDAVAAGCDPADGPYDDARTDGIVEAGLDGTVIWEWWFFDHGIQNIDATKANYVGAGNISDHPGRINLNLPGRPLGKSWLDCNSIDYNGKLDQAVINSELGEFYVVDHGATFVPGDPAASRALAAGPAGDFLYRFGDPARYGQGTPPSVNKDWTMHTTGNKQIGGSNNVHWISPGLPGEGNILVFNNGQYYFDRSAQSYVFEVAPFWNKSSVDTGGYVNPPDAGYRRFTMPSVTLKAPKLLSNQTVWIYYSQTNLAFFSHLGSSAQRLPNGNTMVCAMTDGHLFEVTSAGTPVWEYINPVTANGPVELMYDNYPMTNPVFRALRYGAGHPALEGKDLSPGGTITGAGPHYMTPEVINISAISPKISNTTHTPTRPTPSDNVTVTSMLEKRYGPASMTLTYKATSAGGASQESTVFRETMAESPSQPWDGTGADNPWIVTVGPPANVAQRTPANFGDGNPCGLVFETGTPDLNDTMIQTALGIDARGNSTYVEFHLWANGLEGTDGWTFQLDSGSGYATRLSELAGQNHDWQLYRYELLEAERVAGLKMRFQFRAGDQGDRVRLDQIYVNVSSEGGSANQTLTRPMFDDGAHGDGKAGDWTFGAFIAPFPGGTRVDYYVTAVALGVPSVTDPAGAPASTYSYTVEKGTAAQVTGKLPDTGQTGYYTATFGEDSDYTINPPLFTDNGERTVIDNVTGLEWQKADGGEMTWENALSYADDQTFGGHDDWRLPSSSELFNLLDHGRQDPAMDTAFFPDTGAQYYWSGTALVGDASKIWSVNSGGGIGAHPGNETVSAGGNRTFHVRCVRGAEGGPGGGAFVDNGNGTVTSVATSLEWQKTESPVNLTWEEALTYCEGLVLGGHDDWRLPNVKELRSLSNDTLSKPSVDAGAFPGARSENYWTSTTELKDTARGWFVNFEYGLVSYDLKTGKCFVRAVRGGTNGTGVGARPPELVSVPGGKFEMGDHGGAGGGNTTHDGDELPIHNVTVDGFQMGRFEVTNAQYCDFLNSALGQGTLRATSDGAYSQDGTMLYCDVFSPNTSSWISWDGRRFAVMDGRNDHPATGVRLEGAVAYCNWLSVRSGLKALYDLGTGQWNQTAGGYRLPTEAEWEYAALGGQYDPYPVFPWGSDADAAKANWPDSADPYETGPGPWTTPVGFYNGSLRQKGDHNWPGNQTSYQTGNGSNPYGLYDMAGNAWEWVNDLYNKDYYSFSPFDNPAGPDNATLMPDGKAYHTLRGGSWYDGEYGHSRVADRSSGYYRGPQDPDAPYYHIGFRVVLSSAPVSGGVVEPGAWLVKLAGGFGLAEGPAADAAGNLYFTVPSGSRIYKWSLDGKLSIFRNGTGGANGLSFDAHWDLVACEGDNKRVVSIDMANAAANVSVLADKYNGKAFNQPNDLWIAPGGGIYFTDPIYGTGTLTQDGEHVYYLGPAAKGPVRVVADMVGPNGIVGTPDGRTLYISDRGAGKTYIYTVLANGSLAEKRLFVPVGSDGMTLDAGGNVYLTSDSVLVYDRSGARIDEILVPERPTNLEFGGSDRHTLFITTEKGLCSIRMAAAGQSSSRLPGLFINEMGQDRQNGTAGRKFWVEIFNNGSGPEDLGGMYLTNDLSRPTAWMIPANTTIKAGGFLVVWADNEASRGPLHATFELAPSGGVVGLYSKDGVTLIDHLAFGPQLANASYGRYPDGTDRFIFMHDHPSPGGPNIPDDTGGKPPVVAPPVLTIGGAGAYILLAVVATVAAVAAGLFIYNRRKDRKGPEADGAKQQP